MPTVAETVPGYEASALFGMGAPRKTPPEIIEKLNKEINAVLAEPEIRKRLIELGGEPLIGTPAGFRRDDRGRDRKMGEGGQVFRRQSGIGTSGTYLIGATLRPDD